MERIRRHSMKKAFLLMLWIGAGTLCEAQESSPAPFTPLELELTLTRPGSGDVDRATYTLYVLANSGSYTNLRVGREVAVPVTSFANAAEADTPGRASSKPLTSYQYRNVGINVSCRASSSGERFRLELQLERSSLDDTEEVSPSTDLPSFRTFNVNAGVLLGDGGSTHLVLGNDRSLGASWNVDVKLVVEK
jgi:hypothetical protein